VRLHDLCLLDDLSTGIQDQAHETRRVVREERVGIAPAREKSSVAVHADGEDH
jgi:hypothetical protein